MISRTHQVQDGVTEEAVWYRPGEGLSWKGSHGAGTQPWAGSPARPGSTVVRQHVLCDQSTYVLGLVCDPGCGHPGDCSTGA